MIKNIIISLILLGLSLSCQKQNKPESKHSQVLRINFYAFPSSFQPSQSCDIGTDTVCSALYEGLTRINSKGAAELTLAEKVEISPCKKQYTFTLRPSKWSNGEKLTSYHFVNAWKKALSPQSFQAKLFFLFKNAKPFYKGELTFEKVGIQALSENTLRIELEHPVPFLLQVLANPVYSPVYDMDFKEPNIFNGPFIIENLIMDEKLDLVANPLYWDAKSVKLKKIEISLVKDLNTAFSMYEKGQLDWIGAPFSPTPTESIKFSSNIKLKSCSSPFWLFCNTQNPKLQSANIRKALFYSINQKELIENILIYQQEIHSVLPNDLSNLTLSHCSNTAKANDLLEEGLKELGMDREDFDLTIIHNNTLDYQRLALYLKNEWESKLGIKIHLQKDDWNSFYSKIKLGNYEIGGFFVINMWDDPSFFMQLFEETNTNHSKWENKMYQTYLSLAKESISEEQRRRYLRQAEETLIDKMPVIPLCNRVFIYSCNQKLKGLEPPTFTYSDFKWAYFED